MTSIPSPIPAESWLELHDGRTHWLKGSCAIGRQSDNDLVLDLPALSRRHALLAAEAGGYTLSDLRSRNGTFLNGTAITRPVNLRDGDEIRLGDSTLRFRCTRRATLGARAPADFAATQRLDHVRESTCWLLLIDVVAFTTLNEQLGSEAALRQMQAWITGVRPLIEQHEGHINGYLGDAVFAYWAADTAPAASVLAALSAVETWRAASPLPFRLVAHHGKVLFTHSDRGEELTGQEVNFLFRSEKLAKSLNVSAMLSQTAVHTLGLEGRCPPCGQAAIEGMTGAFSFFSLPVDFAGASAVTVAPFMRPRS